MIVDRLKDVKLKCFDVLDCKLLVRDLLIHHLHFQRVNVLILGCNEHTCNSNDVQITDFPCVLLVLEVSVDEAHSEEECLVVTFEVGKHLDHPVDHSGTQCWRDFVSHEGIVSQKLDFELSRVVEYRFAIICVYIDVLTLNFCGLFS